MFERHRRNPPLTCGVARPGDRGVTINHRIRRTMAVTAIAGLSVAFAACGDDDADDADAAVDRYCDAVAAAEERGEELFSDVDENDEAARLAAERAMVDFVKTTFPEGDELPAEIRDDFPAFLAGLERNTEAGQDPTAEQQAAEERLLAWEDEHCSGE